MNKKKVLERKEIAKKDQWNLTPMFKDDAMWLLLFGEVEEKMKRFIKFKGCLGSSLKTLRNAIEERLSVEREIEKLHTYAHLKHNQDKSDQFYEGRFQKATNLYTRFSELASFMTPEIQSIPDKVMQSYLESEEVEEYKFFLEKILRDKPHTHDEKIEKILAMAGEMAGTASQIFSQLDNVDLKFGTIVDETGAEVELSHGNFQTFLINPDREVRREVFCQYYRAYKDHEHTIAMALTQSNKKDLFYSRVRSFKNCRSGPLFEDNVPEAVYDNLIKTVRDNLGPLFKYLNFRKEVLGVDDLHFYDTYVPIVPDVDFKMTYKEAVDICVKALAPLGKEYVSILEKGLLGGWVDRYENKGKKSGAFSSGCYDSSPYILMNYEEKNLNSLYTLIHEAGHSMHSHLSKENQPYVDADYTIFLAEVASTFNEVLLSRYLLDYYENDPKMRMYILNREIDNIRATLYRQTMFAEFEKISHGIVEQNQPLTLEVITKEYRKLLDVYFGDTIHIDPELELEALRIPHFYHAFYVYKYATGISAAVALVDKVIREGMPAREAYLDSLKLGGSKFPLDALLTAGVDMSSPAPIEKAMGHFEKLVDQLMIEFKKI